MAGESLIDLRKKVDIVLAKRNIKGITAQVGLAMDASGSMKDLYEMGVVQSVTTRLLAVAGQLDDNGLMDMWSFHREFNRLPPVSEKEFDTYVRTQILENRTVTKWGGTSYAPVLEDVMTYYFGKSTGGFLGFGRKTTVAESAGVDPVLLNFITDGANDDQDAATALFESAKAKPVYFNLIGIGHEGFDYIRQAAEDFPNVGFVAIRDITRISDDDLYNALITDELSTWFRK